MNRILSILAASVVAMPAFALDFETMEKAQNLGNILGSESFCGLSFNQDAIAAWVDDNVPASSMSFSGDLQGAVAMSQITVSSMSESAKTAHCRSIERTAKHLGFLE